MTRDRLKEIIAQGSMEKKRGAIVALAYEIPHPIEYAGSPYGIESYDFIAYAIGIAGNSKYDDIQKIFSVIFSPKLSLLDIG